MLFVLGYFNRDESFEAEKREVPVAYLVVFLDSLREELGTTTVLSEVERVRGTCPDG